MVLSVAVEAVTVGETFRDYYKFARLEKTARRVKENGEHCGGTPAPGSSWETRRTFAAEFWQLTIQIDEEFVESGSKV
jgi:hypothetical protein